MVSVTAATRESTTRRRVTRVPCQENATALCSAAWTRATTCPRCAAPRAWPAFRGRMRSWRRSFPRWPRRARCSPRSRRWTLRGWRPPRAIAPSDMADLAFTSMTDLARMIATKAVSPVDVVREHLERIARLESLRAYITVCGDAALEAARAAEAAVMAGGPLGPLHGVPIALKDLFDTRGVRTTAGSLIRKDHVPTEDATVVRRLREAGAIVLGKLNMHEFAYGPEGLNAHYGHARNPWDAAAERIAGGSSSGSGVAVAAGLAAGALGTDTGGSIRIPASLCGITGLKPTYGRVSRAGAVPLSWSMDHIGPMTRSAADCALMLRAMAGYDAADATSSVLPVPDYAAALTGDVKGLRIGLLRDFFLDGAAPDVKTAVEQAARTLTAAGAVVDEVRLPLMDAVGAAAFAVVACEALAWHAPTLRTRASEYQPD